MKPENIAKKSKEPSQRFAHFYTVLAFISRFTFLLFIPLLQYLLFQPRTVTEIVTNVGINILFVIVIIAFAILEYRSISYNQDEKSLILKKGYIIKRNVRFPYKYMQSVLVQRNVLPSIFGAVKVKVDMPAYSRKKSDLSIILWAKNTAEILRGIYKSNESRLIYSSSFFSIILMAFTWSNSITGLLIFIPFLNHAGTVLGQHFTQLLLEQMDFSIYIAAIGIPPVISSISWLLILGFIVAFVVQVFRYGRFSVKKAGKCIIIDRGLISRVRYITEEEHINSYTIRQNLPMALFKIGCVYMKTIGAGKAKGDKSLLIPAKKEKNILKYLDNFHSISLEFDNLIKPTAKSAVSYIFHPLVFLAVLSALYPFFYKIGILGEVMQFLLITLAITVLLWLGLRILAYHKSRFGWNEKNVVICCYSFLNVTAEIIPLEKIQYICISQSILQKKFGRCDIKISFFSENNESFTVHHLEYDKVIKSVSDLENSLDFMFKSKH